MTAYRLKHIPTGLYYIPSREVKVHDDQGRYWYQKTNLSKKGKVYSVIPTLKWMAGTYYTHLTVATKPFDDVLLSVVESEWVVEVV